MVSGAGELQGETEPLLAGASDDRDVHGATLAEDGCGPAGFAGGAAGKIGLEAAGYFLPTCVATTATL